jgi:hypothetical protein
MKSKTVDETAAAKWHAGPLVRGRRACCVSGGREYVAVASYADQGQAGGALNEMST